jgi:glycosyltransferase involved in cell wall biosynthesis
METAGTNILPLVSIIITNHNYARYLCDAVDSALSQTYERKEIIIVDDGSTDHSRQIISDYGDRIIAVLKDNGGQGSAFNRGFLACKGDIVFFLDADDLLLLNAVELVVKKWRRDIIKVQYRLQVTDGQGKPGDSFMPPKKYVMPNGDMRPQLLSHGTYMTSPCSGNAYSRYVLEKVLPVPEEAWRMSADVYVQISSVFYGNIISIEEVLGYYRIHGENKWYSKTLDIQRIEWGLAKDRRRRTLILNMASQFNLKVSFTADTLNSYQIVKKLAIMVLNPHNAPSRDIAGIILKGIRVVWSEPDVSMVKRLFITLFLMLSPLFPRSIAKMLFLWYIYPQNRPSFLQRIL